MARNKHGISHLKYIDMEVAVYMNFEARSNNKPVFKRVVSCPDAFEYDSFVRVMRQIFGDKAVIEFIVV